MRRGSTDDAAPDQQSRSGRAATPVAVTLRSLTNSATACKNSPPVTVTVTGTPNLTLAKAADKTSVVGGDTITYTLSYGNNGNATATGVTIVETVPDGTSYVSCTGGCTVNGSSGTWSARDDWSATHSG